MTITVNDTLLNTYNWFGKARPEPTDKDFHSQLGCHFEEVKEMLDEILTQDHQTSVIIDQARIALTNLADHLKKSEGVVFIDDDERYLDALCDQIVTGAGCAYVGGFRIVSALAEVNRSNYSKFDSDGKPIFNEDKKVIKGPNYIKADLKPYIIPE